MWGGFSLVNGVTPGIKDGIGRGSCAHAAIFPTTVNGYAFALSLAVTGTRLEIMHMSGLEDVPA
jgi:hypothetical protein